MTDAELDQLVAEALDRLKTAEDAVKRYDMGDFDAGIMAHIRADNVDFFKGVVKALNVLAAVRGERDRMRAALSAIAKGWVIETVATQALARQALGDTHD